MSKTGLFLGGVPTDPEVKRLMEAFPEIEPGRTITYAEVTAIIGERHGSSRFRTVTTAWRARLRREQNFVMAVAKGSGFVRLTEAERSEFDAKGWVGKIRGGVRFAKDMQHVETSKLSDKELDVHTHRARVTNAWANDARTVTREAFAPKPTAVQALPRVGKIG